MVWSCFQEDETDRVRHIVLYNAVLVSAAEQSESTISTYIPSLLNLTPLPPHPTPPGPAQIFKSPSVLCQEQCNFNLKFTVEREILCFLYIDSLLIPLYLFSEVPEGDSHWSV